MVSSRPSPSRMTNVPTAAVKAGSWKQFRAVATRYDRRDYIFNGTLTAAAVIIWLRDTVPEPSATA